MTGVHDLALFRPAFLPQVVESGAPAVAPGLAARLATLERA